MAEALLNQNPNPSDLAVYANGWEHIADELEILDLLIQAHLALQQTGERQDPASQPFKGLFITEEEVAALLDRPLNAVYSDELRESAALRKISLLEERVERKVHLSVESKVYLPLSYMAGIFGLSRFESKCLLLCLAPEADRKYEKLFGFLQDDVTCKYPTPDLAMKLFCRTPEQRLEARLAFSPKSTLNQYFVVREAGDSSKSFLSRPLQLDERIMRFLLDSDRIDEEIAGCAEVVYPSFPSPPLLFGQHVQEQLQSFISSAHTRKAAADKQNVILFLHGPAGAGKKLHVRSIGRTMGQPVLFVDLKLLLHAGKDCAEQLSRLFREAILLQTAVCFDHFELLLGEEEAAQRNLLDFLTELKAFHGLIFLCSSQGWKPAGAMRGYVYIDVEFSMPDASQRKLYWEHFAAGCRFRSEIDWGEMAGKFRLTPGQIESALSGARDIAWWRESESGLIGREELYEACFREVRHKLEKKSVRLKARYTWDDLVLPKEQTVQLKNACNQIRYRHIVYGEWGFDRKLSYGKGLSMLLSGPPGTGKTMSAEIIANDLNLEIYKIDLSQLISKYIGETEKNLQEVFQEAQLSNAILFFDETDALFGKRSEVKDSHDKYANVETAFLLQKMEEYEGISVLATNYLQNIDEAFMRRINYIIKFPFPDPAYRQQIWRSMFPEQAPLHRDVDFRYLGQTFEIAGGNIKNIVVSSAFLAAEKNEPVGMKHILTAVRHELNKTGRIVPKEELGEYAYLFSDDA